MVCLIVDRHCMEYEQYILVVTIERRETVLGFALLLLQVCLLLLSQKKKCCYQNTAKRNELNGNCRNGHTTAKEQEYVFASKKMFPPKVQDVFQYVQLKVSGKKCTEVYYVLHKSGERCTSG
jgi:hypothetical protein